MTETPRTKEEEWNTYMEREIPRIRSRKSTGLSMYRESLEDHRANIDSIIWLRSWECVYGGNREPRRGRTAAEVSR